MRRMEDLERKLDQLMKEPGDPALFNEIGVFLYQVKDWRNALRYLERACRLDGSDADILYNYALLLYLQRQWKKAAEICEAYLELQQDDEEMLKKAGDSYYQSGDYEAAARMYQRSQKEERRS